MTPTTKPTKRLTSAYVFDRGSRPLVAILHNGHIELRPRGLKCSEVVDLAGIYQMAVKARIISERAAKKAKRKQAK